MPLALTTKKRNLPPPGGRGVLRTQYFHSLSPPQPVETKIADVDWKKLKGVQITASENHPGWADASPTDGDVGGPFYTSKKAITLSGGGASEVSGNTVKTGGAPYYITSGYRATYSGPILACDPAAAYVAWPVLAGRSDAVLEALGTKAIAIVKPTNSIADLATALIELYREGLPKMVGSTLWKEKTKEARNAALRQKGHKKASQEFLNLEFAWKPIVGEIKDVYKAVKTADAVYKQYERDAGRVVRRKFEFPSDTSSSSSVLIASHVPHLPVNSSILSTSGSNTEAQLRRGRLIQTDTYERRTWFSGAFTYHLPRDWYKKGSSSKMDKLFGTNLTPEVVWNVTPWSWLADWFANTGDVISNLTDMATDGLVLRYGYIMEHERHVRTYSYEGPTNLNNREVRPQSINLVVETKRRLAATPYGFGITWEGFSARQAAILAALGISRSGKGK